MIKNQWYAALEAREVPRGRPVGVLRFGEKLVLWRDGDGRVCCTSDRCVHRGASLSAGKVCGGHVECPFHGFRYDATGRCRLLPANGRAQPIEGRFRVPSYPVREAHGLIYLYWGEAGTEPDELPYFDDLAGLSYSTFRSHWPVHYSRAIENQLDAVHLPFVHHNTIGRGMGTLVNGPLVEWLADDHLRFHVFNEPDTGQALKPVAELSPAAGQVFLDFRFPNVWQNVLSEKMRIFAAFVPVDENNTLIYLRIYQGIVRLPVLRRLFEASMQVANRVILGQDRRVVVTQRPIKSALRMEEQLVAGDRPIIEYRKRRQELLDDESTAE